MLILGIDPGTATTGWALVSKVNSEYKLVCQGAIVTSKDKDQSERLAQIYDFCRSVIKKYKPTEVAIERLFFNKNLKTALTVMQTHGVVRLAAFQAGTRAYEYTPLQVKMAITGYGKAEKQQVQYMVFQLLKLPAHIKQDDTADAIAIALCHLYNFKAKMKMQSAK